MDGTSSKGGSSFSSMGLEKDILSGLNRMGYKQPTPVQRKALPIALAGMDMVCMARTGSGKTCVFLLPLVQRLKVHDSSSGVRAIVLSPTRELAMQTYKFAKDMAKFTDLRVVSIVGGDPLDAQFEALSSRPDILIATPGRLMHMLREISTFKLKSVKYLVFDEADRLFEMGFAEQLNEIVRECPEERQTLLFSATMPKMLIQFSRAGLRDPQLVRLDTDTKMSDELRMGFFSLRSNEKTAALLYLVRNIIPEDQLTIIFTATRHHSEFIHSLFSKIGVTSTVVYGTMDQDCRTNNLKQFRSGEVSYLIVTDVAARGIDVPLLNNVINYHFPPTPKLFVHRCGRAARQGRIGYAFSLVEPEELAFQCDVLSFLGKDMVTSYTNTINGDSVNVSGYKLETMTPDMIHTGKLPQDVIDEENEFVKKWLNEDDQLNQLYKTSENGMQQYKRTRTEATREGLKKAKSVVKNNEIRSIHPLIIGSDPVRCNQCVVDKANFVRMLQTFRPSQTVFETGIGTGSKSAAKNINKAGSKEAHGSEVMKAFRKATSSALERNKVSVLIDKDDNNGDADDDDNALHIGDSSGITTTWDMLDIDAHTDEYYVRHDNDNDDSNGNGDTHVHVKEVEQQPRLSISEKKKLKKRGYSQIEIKEEAVKKAKSQRIINDATGHQDNSNSSGSNAGNKGTDFKDRRFYMSYGNENEHARFEEDSLQPRSGLKSAEAQSATMLENALLDVDPDEALEINRKKRISRWDSKKRKFVKQSLEEMLNSSNKGAKRIRTESGVTIKGSNAVQGAMYEKWKKKSKREIDSSVYNGDGVGSSSDSTDNRPRPNFKYNSHVKDEIKNKDEIKKGKRVQEKNKLKNMDKDKRRVIQGKNKKSAAASDAKSKHINRTKAGGNKKVKAVLRY